MAFTAKDVQALREKTGVGMMECKKALTATDGDMDKAIEVLREKGLAAAAKKSGRIAAEGVVLAMVDDATKVGVVIEVNSETDFVAKNEKFMEFVTACAKTVAANKPADVDALMQMQMVGSSMTVEEELRDKILTIGENMKIRRFIYAEGDVVTYVHGGGRIGVMVTFDTDVAGKDGFTEYAKDVAMQIAALSPAYLDEASVPAEVIEKEKEILTAQIQNDEKLKNKPAQIIAKMVDGRISKYYKENCLVDQAFVKNGDMTVGQYTAEMAKTLGGSIKITGFVRYEKGEGLEKRSDNFADEVASMMK
ncbi:MULTISPECIES: translation elongation factor Ts [Anaerotruncus]|jgi:elongation factor Ts|uniref:translation elongation factor Ts n=1 Tax=Anaerotruncus TaxID=244127 RepID=UPI000830DEB8|nr:MULTISPECIES: translation elongation factor Ts [Anaerotruncus]RGX56528.1 elongation factor Ts [Anaerotruncus sp. AF02-27]